MKRLITITKKQPVLCIATVAMLITCFFIHPDKDYLDYFDFKTLSCLFCTLEVVCGFSRIHTFELAAEKLVHNLSNARNVITGVVFITYVGSMLLANDMALLTFLPLGYFVLKTTGKKKYMAYTFVLQNIAANLGGMINPFGNLQNLYLYSYYQIDTMEFMQIMFLPFLVALILIIICCLLIPAEPMELVEKNSYSFHGPKTVIYSILFTVSILAVLRFLPYQWCTLFVTAAMLLVDRRALLDVNYGLLATFAVFFVFSGNMARISAVQEIVSVLIQGRTLLLSLCCCQFFSNVPTAVMLSHFTTDYANLLVAVNVGAWELPLPRWRV
ncbi:MAG: SLC13 family permease [Acetatifactor sp.]